MSLPDKIFYGLETGLDGEGLLAGTIVQGVLGPYAPFFTIASGSPFFRPAMIFDSAAPSGDDEDLGTPNEDFSGPGVGAGGEAGQPGENARALGNVLILSTDRDSSDPNDHAGGGTLAFTFPEPTTFFSVDLIDMDDGETSAQVRAYDGAGQLLFAEDVGALGDNSVQTFERTTEGVQRLEVELAGSGALDNLEVLAPEDNGFDSLAPDTIVAGKSFEDWAGEWLRRGLYAPLDSNPLLDEDGSFANVDNDGAVFFVAGTFGGPAERSFDVPEGRPLFLPVLNFLSIAFPTDPPDYVEVNLQLGLEQMTGMYARIDGQNIADIEDYLVTNADVPLTAPEDSLLFALLSGDPTIDPLGTFDAGVTGYWLMIDALTAGRHTLEFGGWFDVDQDGIFDPEAGDFAVDVKDTIEVVPEDCDALLV